MANSTRVLVLALMPLLGASVVQAASQSAGQKGSVTYRWVDENGVVHYGDSVPAQYAKKESSILNSQGVEIGHLEAQRTPEQLAEDAHRQDALVRQKQHDSFLLTTYTSVKDIEGLRDERLTQIQVQRNAAQQYIENLRGRLGTLQTRAMMFKPYSSRAEARRMPDDLAEDLVRTLNELRTQNGVLKSKDQEEATLRAQFQADIERYKQLHVARNAD